MNPTEEFEIYQFLCKEAEAYVSLSQLLKDAHLTMEAAVVSLCGLDYRPRIAV